MQMRFVRAGAPFCEIGAKSTVGQVGFYRNGSAFFPTSTEVTAPTYTIAKSPIKAGAPFLAKTGNSTTDAHYGRATRGTPFYVAFSGTSVYPSYTGKARLGAPFANLIAKSSIDAHYGRAAKGAPFYVAYSGTSVYPVYVGKSRFGAPFANLVAKTSINAENGFYRQGTPFWVKYTGAPPPFNASRFFLLF
jgi:hypothetical protein